MANELKKIAKIYPSDYHKENAGNRVNGVDTPTSFSIPGWHIKERHANVELNVTAVVCSDMTVYISVHNGRIYQYVYGKPYTCKLFACYHPFEMIIPVGINSWDGVKFKYNGKEYKANEADVKLVSDGEVYKTYDISTPFEWMFGDHKAIEEGKDYYSDEITAAQETYIEQNGGYSKSTSTFVNIGNLADVGWKKELGSSSDGKIYICGGVIYPDGSKITDAITSESFAVTIPGLNMAAFYYPGDIRHDVRESLNRPGGYLRIYKPDREPVYLLDDVYTATGWRSVKNTENDRAVELGHFENWGFRLEEPENNKWVRLIISGQGGEVDEDDTVVGIGSDSPGGSGSGSGSGSGCCCCCRGGS